ncbi:NADP-dependent oxidoreductase [Mucilaginibacter gynuensis]|uniref:NADP-dependent oxidoreductase n=1 Tax=Mucilaginibacter gynuensis TaxID=1302236 RepID=A0ABP8FSF6_9SPHI
MKAIILNAFGDTNNFTERTDLPLPVPGDNDVLIRIIAAGFNPIDYQMRQGKSEKKHMKSPILGREFSGIVVKTGKDARKFKKGMAVFAASGSMGSNGTYAEYISVPENILATKPPNLTFEEAAAVPLANLTAMQTYKRLKPQQNDTFFVSGAAGGVGLALIKILLYKGFRNVVVTAGNDESRNQLIAAGVPAERIIDYRVNDIAAKIVIANNQSLFDHCIDIVGGELSELCAQLLITNGTYADITAHSTANARETLFGKGATVLNISNYAYALKGETGYYGNNLQEISTLLEKGVLSPPHVNLVGELSVITVKHAHYILENNLTKGKKLVMQIQTVSVWVSVLSKIFFSQFFELYKHFHLVK